MFLRWLMIGGQSAIALVLALSANKQNPWLFVPRNITAIALIAASASGLQGMKKDYEDIERQEDVLRVLKDTQAEEQLQYLESAAERKRSNEEADLNMERQLKTLGQTAPLFSEVLGLTGQSGPIVRMALAMLQNGSSIGDALSATAEAEMQMEQIKASQAIALQQRQVELVHYQQQQQPIQQTVQVIAQNNSTPYAWVLYLVKQTCLIWGNQGGGKSWLARYVIKQKKEAGYKIIVLDPDSNRAEWKGVESYHSWEDIEEQIRAYVEELELRLRIFNDSSFSESEWREKLWSDGKALALICEEATTYGDFIKDSELLEKFGKLALTKSRKQEMPLTIVAHNNTQTCLFGIKGLHNLVSKMLQVECLAEVNPVTLQPSSTGKAKVKLDSSVEWLLVELPKMAAKISNFSDDIEISD